MAGDAGGARYFPWPSWWQSAAVNRYSWGSIPWGRTMGY